MTCDELRPEYMAYALGVAGDPERLEIAVHLGRDCPECVAGVKEALEVVAAMSGAVKIVEPPQRLRGRVVSLVAPDSGKRVWGWNLVPWVTSFALAVALIVALVPSRQQPAATAKLEQALTILGDPAARDVSFGQPAARGRVFVSPGRGVVFIAAGLPSLEPHRTFELWVIPATGNPVPAGTFHGEAGSALYVSANPAANAAAVAVSVEPEGGSPQPTTTPFIVAKL